MLAIFSPSVYIRNIHFHVRKKEKKWRRPWPQTSINNKRSHTTNCGKMSRLKNFVKCEVFLAMQNVDVAALNKLPEKDLRPVLPCLVRMALCKPLDESESWSAAKKEVLKILSGIEVVNTRLC